MTRQIRMLGIGLMVCFGVLFVQLNRLTVFQAAQLNDNPNNTREILRDFTQPRGTVTTADGVVIAQSVPSNDRFELQRQFPEGALFAGITGYYSFTLGSAGVERTYNDELAGRTLDLSFQSLGDLFVDKNRTGDLNLSVRADLQRIAASQLGERKGAVVALDPRNGEILAMVSFPSYDPNLLANHDTQAAADAATLLDSSPDKPRLIRAYQDRFFPGSTFKVVTATAGLTSGTITADQPSYPPATSYTPPGTNRPLQNFGGSSCGGTLFEILRVSCNSAFAQMGVDTGADNMVATAERFGFNKDVPIDLTRPAKSNFPTDFSRNVPALAQSAIGQNDVAATPLQMAMVAAGVANDGQIMVPHVLRDVRDNDGNIVDTYDPDVWTMAMDRGTAALMREAMIGVVERGTATRLKVPGFVVGGKTGTAQLGTPEPRSHAWIIGFGGPPNEPASIAVAVIIEGQAGASEQTGGRVAAPIAQALMQAYLTTPLTLKEFEPSLGFDHMSEPGPTVFNGRYELHRRLGRGGMAEVFLARDQLLDRPVAVKVLFPEFATDPSFVERFRREATAAANLNHPNIVGVYDWGEADNTYFIVMEYVDGRTLSEILRSEGPLHPDRAADVGADVAAALGFAHRNGVVHRDVKPGNVIVTASGLVKVADFGIARAITASSEEDLTQVGTVMGTAAYFSPEQARGDAVDPRSDIYSLGCVLYELVVGRAPFAGDSPVAIAYKHVHEQPIPPRHHNIELPQALEAIILKCLAKNPANRYPSAEDLRADLRRFREGNRILAEPVMAPPVDPGATGVLAATAAVPAAHEETYLDEYEEDDEPRRSGAFLAALIVLLLLLAGMLFLLARALGVGDDGDPTGPLVEVPNVIGMPVEQATTTLEALEFDVVTASEANDDQPAGVVFDQNPVRGEKVEEGSTVQLKVSAGAEAIPVPGVIGSQVDEARRLLSGLGFVVAEEPIADEDAPVGEVVDQSPAPDEEAPKGSTVTLQVSSGPQERPVPDVTGRSLSEASNLLGQNGFTVDQESEPSTTVDEGKVIRTEPAAGTPQPKGATITVVVSSGPPKTTVPSVVGLSESNAIDALESKGFEVNVTEQTTPDPTKDGKVISQNPAGNTSAEQGSTVSIVIGVFSGEPPPDP